MQEETSQTIQHMYKRYTDMRMDAKTCSYWLDGFRTQTKNMRDLTEYIRASADYSKALQRRFAAVYLELIGTDADAASVDNFVEIHRERIGELLDTAAIREVIAVLPAFEFRHADLVRKMHASMHHDHELSEADITEFVNKFRKSSEYDIDQLHADLKSFKADATKHDADVDTDSDEENEESEPEAEPELAAAERYPAWADTWEEVFGRPLYVQEYLLFNDVLSKTTDQQRWIADYKNVFKNAFLLTTDILHKFAGNSVYTEYQFVKQYLQEYFACYTTSSAAAPEEFCATLKNRILRSDDYHDAMYETLRSAYNQTYDTKLDDEAIGYMFTQALEKRLSLSDAMIQELVVAFKAETDEYVERVYRLHLEVYQREPDADEVDAYVAMYRRNGKANVAVTERQICKSLIATLEFHDVLKKKIRLLSAERGVELSTSAIYRCLNECLECIKKNSSDIDSMNAVLDIVQSEISHV